MNRPPSPLPGSSSARTADIRLLLRAHGEQHWLLCELYPVIRQLEHGHAVPEDQLGAAFAYLEALWIEAQRRATDTDCAFSRLEPRCSGALRSAAHRYHHAVRVLRAVLACRVEKLLAPGANLLAREPTG